MTDIAEFWAHLLIAALCAVILWFVHPPWSWTFVIWLMGFLRETVQRQRLHPGLQAFAFWRWSKHKRMEMWAWLIGAASVGLVFAILR